MKWIKASERNPEKSGEYYVNIDGEKGIVKFIKGDGMFIDKWVITFYDDNTELQWLDESTMAEGQQQGEGVKPFQSLIISDMAERIWNLNQQLTAKEVEIKGLKEILLQIDKSLYIGKDLDDTEILKWYIDVVSTIKEDIRDLLNSDMVLNGASQQKLNSSTFADTIKFLDLIDSSSMSDKTWLAEQKNLRKEGKELRERLTGKEIEEVIVKLKK